MGRLDFLKQYGSTKTVESYEGALKKFFETVYEEKDDLESLAERYFSEDRDIKQDVQAFAISIKEYAPKSRSLWLSAVKTFLIENDIELHQKFWRSLRRRIRGSRALTEDKVPSSLELRKIMMHLPVQGKALYLFLASSGMRIGEALQITPEDVDLSFDPRPKVIIRGEYTKSGNKRISFISREAKEAVEEWLKVRLSYLETAVAKSFQNKDADDPRLFPFTTSNARRMWKNALVKAGIGGQDPRTKITSMHPHTLRKFFRSKMGTVIPVDVVEALMGHEGYLTEVYRKYPNPEKTLSDFYLSGEYVLSIFTDADEVGKLREEVEKSKEQLQTLVNGLTSSNLTLQAQVTTLEEKQRETEKKIEPMVNFITEMAPLLVEVFSDEITGFKGFSDEKKAAYYEKLKSILLR